LLNNNGFRILPQYQSTPLLNKISLTPTESTIFSFSIWLPPFDSRSNIRSTYIPTYLLKERPSI
jgi:hypothetical protein